MYLEVQQKYNTFKNSLGLIDAKKKAESTFSAEMSLDKLLYSEFSALEIFGKTKIYTQLLYAKLNQDRKLIRELIKQHQIQNIIQKIITQYDIEAVGFVPSTIPRTIQFQKELEYELRIPLPKIKIEKVSRGILVAQKTLKKTSDRIMNSKETFVVPQQHLGFSNILLIDDFVGSASTLNFVAKKVRQKTPSKQTIIGYALCGTPNGVVNASQKFEVVQEI